MNSNGSLYDLSLRERKWMVQHRDGSDAGVARVLFADPTSALSYAREIRTNPPKGEHFHPAPSTLDLRVFEVRRIEVTV